MKRVFIYDDGALGIIRFNNVADQQLRTMENAIMRGDGDTVAGTGGIKKIRCAVAHKGKSGSIRVLFADYPIIGRTYILAAFGKNEKENISKAEARDLGVFKRSLDKALERMLQNAKQN